MDKYRDGNKKKIGSYHIQWNYNSAMTHYPRHTPPDTWNGWVHRPAHDHSSFKLKITTVVKTGSNLVILRTLHRHCVMICLSYRWLLNWFFHPFSGISWAQSWQRVQRIDFTRYRPMRHTVVCHTRRVSPKDGDTDWYKRRKGKLGARLHAMKRVAAGAHLPTPWLFEPAKRPDKSF